MGEREQQVEQDEQEEERGGHQEAGTSLSTALDGQEKAEESNDKAEESNVDPQTSQAGKGVALDLMHSFYYRTSESRHKAASESGRERATQACRCLLGGGARASDLGSVPRSLLSVRPPRRSPQTRPGAPPASERRERRSGKVTLPTAHVRARRPSPAPVERPSPRGSAPSRGPLCRGEPQSRLRCGSAQRRHHRPPQQACR